MVLDERRKALEEQFFRDLDAKHVERMHQDSANKEAKIALRDASGIADDSLLEGLIQLGISVDTLSAISLVPLVEIAWADHNMDEDEKHAIVRAAEAKGIAIGTSAHELLTDWLVKRPDNALFAAWKDYVGELLEQLTDAQRIVLYHQVIKRTRDVAQAAGGFLGVKTVSKTETDVLADLNAVFGK